jgi:hypothetical protein
MKAVVWLLELTLALLPLWAPLVVAEAYGFSLPEASQMVNATIAAMWVPLVLVAAVFVNATGEPA